MCAGENVLQLMDPAESSDEISFSDRGDSEVVEANGLKFADSSGFRVSEAIGSHVVGKVFEESG
jgi:hypothetical protein